MGGYEPKWGKGGHNGEERSRGRQKRKNDRSRPAENVNLGEKGCNPSRWVYRVERNGCRALGKALRDYEAQGPAP